MQDVALSSDAFFPFRDNIDRASRSGVRYVVQTGGSNRDDEVIDAANKYGMVMAFADLRLFPPLIGQCKGFRHAVLSGRCRTRFDRACAEPTEVLNTNGRKAIVLGASKAQAETLNLASAAKRKSLNPSDLRRLQTCATGDCSTGCGPHSSP